MSIMKDLKRTGWEVSSEDASDSIAKLGTEVSSASAEALVSKYAKHLYDTGVESDTIVNSITELCDHLNSLGHLDYESYSSLLEETKQQVRFTRESQTRKNVEVFITDVTHDVINNNATHISSEELHAADEDNIEEMGKRFDSVKQKVAKYAHKIFEDSKSLLDETFCAMYNIKK